MSDDTPPPLLEAVGKLIAEIIKTASSPEELDGIAEWLKEKRASHQPPRGWWLPLGGTERGERLADHAAETLLSRPAAPAERSRRHQPSADQVLELLRSRRCGRCRKVYGADGVAPARSAGRSASCWDLWSQGHERF